MSKTPVQVGVFSIALASRSEVDGQWVHLLPTGPTRGRDGRGPYKLTDAGAVMEASRQYAGRRQIPIDYDHAIDLAAPNGIAAPAAGWIKSLQARTDGIWGEVDWTPRGAELLAHREYRYLSPVFRHSRDGTINCLLRASLTNNPNIDQLTALASMETDNMDHLPAICAALGLPEDASVDAILAKINELAASRQSAVPDPTKYVPIGDFERAVGEVNRLNQGISLQAATQHVNAQIEAAHLLPWLRDWGISLCSVNKPAFDEFIAKTKGGLRGLLTPMKWPSPLEDHGAPSALSDNEIAIASRMGVSAEDFAKSKSLNSRQDRNR